MRTTIHSPILFLLFLLTLPAALQARVDLPDFTPLVEQSRDAVVNISTTSKPHGGPRLPQGLPFPQLPENSPWNEFFRHFFGPTPGGPGGEPLHSLGSGFIISEDGYIITNHHVIRDADEILVRLSDRREFEAKVIGSDERSDLAVLKIEAEDLPTLKLGDSSKLKVGQWVLAIGSPFGFDYTVTAGIISALGRNLPEENYVPFIQTDVAINPGNSGGPLFDMEGRVIGVNSQIFSRTGGFMGLSFAIPVNVVKNVYHQIREKGTVTRGWLGVLIQDVTRELAESFGMKRPHGALISKVLEDSPAARAGLQTGDIVVRFDGHAVERSGDLPPLVGNTEVGRTVPVEVIRNGRHKTVMVRIGALPRESEVAALTGKGPGGSAQLDQRLGLSLRELNEEQRQEAGVGKEGVLVAGVKQNSPAAEAGVEPGDILLMLDGKKVHSLQEYHEIADKLPAGRTVAVLIQRNGNPVFLALKVPDGK